MGPLVDDEPKLTRATFFKRVSEYITSAMQENRDLAAENMVLSPTVARAGKGLCTCSSLFCVVTPSIAA